MQFKIPQEIDVEDKVVGPFTVRSFGFVFSFFVIMALFAVIFTGTGMSLLGSLIIGGLLASPALALGFVPYNGKPIYTYSGHFVSFLFKPRKRIWKKYVAPANPKKKEEEEEKPVQMTPQKASLKDAEQKIEELSLTVDTAGAYSSRQAPPPKDETKTFMDKDNVTVEKALKETAAEVPVSSEPPISELATEDPDKKFDYQEVDTKGYKVGEMIDKKKNN